MAPTWLITGTSNGFGLALAKHVLSQRHNLVSLSRHAQAHQDLIELHSKTNTEQQGTFHHLQHDLSNPDENVLKILISEFLSTNPALKIDFLVNNAALAAFGSIEKVPTSTIQHLMTVNFYSPLWLIQAILPHMRQHSSPSGESTKTNVHGTLSKVIVNVSSTQGLCCDPAELAYEASKHALEALSGVLAAEVEVFGIRTLVANLGSFRTGFATSGERAGFASSVQETGSGGEDDPYAHPDHPVRRRVDMVRKFANIPDAARGDPAKGAAVLFDAVVKTPGSEAEAALQKQRDTRTALGGGALERLVVGSDGWVKIDQQVRWLSGQIEGCEAVSRMANADDVQ